jgi:hypothetical protein
VFLQNQNNHAKLVYFSKMVLNNLRTYTDNINTCTGADLQSVPCREMHGLQISASGTGQPRL